jgi:hypothetical protein
MNATQEHSVKSNITSKYMPHIHALNVYLEQWDKNYNDKLSYIKLFNTELTSCWSKEQKQYFIQILYHQRAHFDDVLWYMGNFAPDAASKKIILNNICDEFSLNGISHEKLYLEFASSMGVDLTYELIDENCYPKFLKEYNYGHLKWMRDNDWDHRLAGFAALERLDNVDYVSLKNVATSIGAEGKALVFFNVHIHVKHFEEAELLFQELWIEKPEVVKNAFEFIGNYQLNIWSKMSDAIFEYRSN